MVDPTLPNIDLALLTAGFDDPGTDLRDAVTAFADNLAAAVPSLLGVTFTLALDGLVVTLSVQDADLALTSRASLNIPFSVLVPKAVDSTMVFYAADVGAFADLADVVMRSAGIDEPVPTGDYSAAPPSAWSIRVSGLADFTSYHETIGALIDQGYTPDEVRMEFRRRAMRNEATLDDNDQHTRRGTGRGRPG